MASYFGSQCEYALLQSFNINFGNFFNGKIGSADWEGLENEDTDDQNETQELEASDDAPKKALSLKRADSNVWQGYLQQIEFILSVKEKEIKVSYS